MTRNLVQFAAALALALPREASTGEPGARPRDLVDLGKIKAMSLADLGWSEESRTIHGDVLVLGGSWKGPRFSGYNSAYQRVETDLQEAATVYLPRGLPAGATVPQVVWAAHYESYAREVYPGFIGLSGPSRVAFVMHGEKESDWTSLGFESRDSLVGMTLFTVATGNTCEPGDYRFGNFLLALAETNMLALTLLSRLLEAEGYAPGDAAIVGFSKEGFAAWFASAVDDRLVAAAPGGWHLENLVEGLNAEERNWGCNGDLGGAVGGEVLFTFRNWLSATQGGRRALEYFSVDRFAPDLLPGFFLIHGDVGLSGLHDGMYYTPGAETQFLENFDARPFRYDRKPDRDVRESDLDWNTRITGLLTRYLATRDLSTHPKVEEAEAALDLDGKDFQVIARVAPEPLAVRLWWSHSTDRAFDDAGNPPWVSVPLSKSGESWSSPWVALPEGEMIGWYVEAESALEWSGLDLIQRDASPQRFFHELPALQCPGEVPECPSFRRGDSNVDGRVDLSDGIFVIAFIFLGAPAHLPCEDAADSQDDGILDISDAVHVLNYLFLEGPAPGEPQAVCGEDPVPDGLRCEAYSPCGW